VFFGRAIAITSAWIGGYTLPHFVHSYDLNLPYSWSLGAILAALLSTGAYILWLGMRIPNRREALNILAPRLAFAFVLGRLACFAADCCNGKPAVGFLPWAVTFTNPASASNYKNIPVHPTQLYESAGSLPILIVLLALFNHPKMRAGSDCLAPCTGRM
jgi:prolipoprotein diacylglyceryltransferase